MSFLHRIVATLASAKVQGGFHVFGLVVFLALVPPSVLWWSRSVPYLVYLSVYAIVVAHWAGAVAALSVLRTEQTNDNDNGNDNDNDNDQDSNSDDHVES